MQAPWIDAESHPVARIALQLGIDTSRDRIASDLSVEELVRTEHLRHLDFQLQPGMIRSRPLRHRLGADPEDSLLDSGSTRELDVEARSFCSRALHRHRDE